MNNKENTFLIVTYNRCPFVNFEDNPLTWMIRSLEMGKEKPDKYLIVIDGSTDNTCENIKYLQDTLNIKNLQVIENKKRMGCSYSRKVGIENLQTEMFFMGDDDCVFQAGFIENSLKAWNWQSKLDSHVAVLSTPIFEFDIDFKGKIPLEKIAYTDFERAWFDHNIDYFPSEYVNNENMIIKTGEKLLKPFKVQTFKGVTLNSTDAFIKAGNFTDLSMWATDYSEHIEMSLKLERQGYTMYHLPMLEASAIHIRFGTKRIPEHIRPDLQNYSLPSTQITMNRACILSNLIHDSGCRVSDMEFLKSRIGSFMAFFLKVSLEVAQYFIDEEYRNIVKANAVDRFLILKELDAPERYILWKESILAGITTGEKQTNINCKSLRKTVESYKHVY